MSSEEGSEIFRTTMRDISNRIAKKKVELMREDAYKMSNELTKMSQQMDNVEKTYNKLLMKDKPVGSSLKAIRHLR